MFTAAFCLQFIKEYDDDDDDDEFVWTFTLHLLFAPFISIM